jgi:hypothetical protein
MYMDLDSASHSLGTSLKSLVNLIARVAVDDSSCLSMLLGAVCRLSGRATRDIVIPHGQFPKNFPYSQDIGSGRS